MTCRRTKSFLTSTLTRITKTLLNYIFRNIFRKKEQRFELEATEDAGRRYGTHISGDLKRILQGS